MQRASVYLNFEVVGFTPDEIAELDEIGLREGDWRPAFRVYVLGRDLAKVTRRLWDVYPGAR